MKGRARSAQAAPLEEAPSPTFGRWTAPAPLGWKAWAALGAVVLLVNLPLLHLLVRSEPPVTVRLPFTDDFTDPGTVERNYHSLGGYPRVVGGELLSPGTKNNPLWLSAALPHDVVVEVSARPTSPDGEIRVVLFGNGIDANTGYQAILGNWSPMGSPARVGSSLVRLEENSPTLPKWLARAQRPGDLRSAGFGPRSGVRVEAPSNPLDPAHTYRMRFERRGPILRWTVDGQLWAELEDPYPLSGSGHDRLGLSSGEWDVRYDDLRVEAATGGTFAPVGARPAEPVPGPFSDTFRRPDLGADWLATEPAAISLKDGAVLVQGAHNHPLWLRRPIPDEAVIEFDAWSDTPEGDIKVEAWGDGQSYDRGPLGGAYQATGYVFIQGGWRNTLSAIARRNEHGAERVVRSEPRVEPGRKYHWTIRRQGGVISWQVDGQPFLSFTDPEPLRGPGQRYFAFSGWEAPVHFTHLQIRPL